MEYGKFILTGEDKKVLHGIKNSLLTSGHIFIGYAKEPFDILRHIRTSQPDFLMIDVGNHFRELKPILTVIDEDLLASCILILDHTGDEVLQFIRGTRSFHYITKPIYEEMLQQIVGMSLINFERIREYEGKVKKLNDTLESRKLIEKAKWILVEQDGLSETKAYDLIQKKSRDHRISMKEIAEAIIMTRGNS